MHFWQLGRGATTTCKFNLANLVNVDRDKQKWERWRLRSQKVTTDRPPLLMWQQFASNKLRWWPVMCKFTFQEICLTATKQMVFITKINVKNHVSLVVGRSGEDWMSVKFKSVYFLAGMFCWHVTDPKQLSFNTGKDGSFVHTGSKEAVENSKMHIELLVDLEKRMRWRNEFAVFLLRALSLK